MGNSESQLTELEREKPDDLGERATFAEYIDFLKQVADHVGSGAEDHFATSKDALQTLSAIVSGAIGRRWVEEAFRDRERFVIGPTRLTDRTEIELHYLTAAMCCESYHKDTLPDLFSTTFCHRLSTGAYSPAFSLGFEPRAVLRLPEGVCEEAVSLTAQFCGQDTLWLVVRGTKSAGDVLADATWQSMELMEGVYTSDGFGRAMTSVWNEIESYVMEHLSIGGRLIITGHSLGAAVAGLITVQCYEANLPMDRIISVIHAPPPFLSTSDHPAFTSLTAYANRHDAVTTVSQSSVDKYFDSVKSFKSGGELLDPTDSINMFLPRVCRHIHALNPFAIKIMRRNHDRIDLELRDVSFEFFAHFILTAEGLVDHMFKNYRDNLRRVIDRYDWPDQ